MLITRQNLKKYIQEAQKDIDEPVDIIIVGGAAVLVLCPSGTATRDIDTLSTDNIDSFIKAMKKAATRLEDHPIDVNTRSDPFEIHMPRDWRDHLVLSSEFSTPMIKIITPRPEDLAVAKVFRFQAKDAEDIKKLASLKQFDRSRFLDGFLDVLAVAIGDRHWHAQSFVMAYNGLYKDEHLDEDTLLSKME